jgi:hypothetical protein
MPTERTRTQASDELLYTRYGGTYICFVPVLQVFLSA